MIGIGDWDQGSRQTKGIMNLQKVLACVNYFEKQDTKYTWWMNTAYLANATIVPVPRADVNRFVKLKIRDFGDARNNFSSRVMGLSSVKLVQGYGIVIFNRFFKHLAHYTMSGG